MSMKKDEAKTTGDRVAVALSNAWWENKNGSRRCEPMARNEKLPDGLLLMRQAPSRRRWTDPRASPQSHPRVPWGPFLPERPSVTLNVARSNDEAERIARGENVLMPRDERPVILTGEAAAEEFFEHPEPAEEGETPDGEAKAK
jgi:hypothetical protein